jgi:hypothetical protein
MGGVFHGTNNLCAGSTWLPIPHLAFGWFHLLEQGLLNPNPKMSKLDFGDLGVVSQSMGEKCVVFRKNPKEKLTSLPWLEFRVRIHPRWRWDLMKKGFPKI